MSWLNRVRNALPFGEKRDTPDNLWHKCRACTQMVFVKEWQDNLCVCPRCGHHDRIGAKDRFDQLFDDAMYKRIDSPAVADDPLTCVALGTGRALEDPIFRGVLTTAL